MKRLSSLLVACFLLAFPGIVAAAPSAQTPTVGAVIALRGTPHIWIVGSDGLLHWGGDTRALAGKTINWNARTEHSLAEIQAMRRGDPWLSSGLVKIGDPIYLSKWESSDTAPTLLHIQSIADVELFGINGTNYGAMVLDGTAWQAKYFFNPATLTKSVLAAAAAPGSSRENPVPIGTAANIPDGWRLTVASVTPNANAQIAAHNSFNKPPASGSQFFIARVSITRTGTSSSRYSATFNLRAVGASNVAYSTFSNSCGVYPDAISSAEVFPGGTITGNICFSVLSSDVGSLVLYDDSDLLSSSGRVYFALR